MVVLLDTNVVFDVLEKRQPHYHASNQILCLCRRKAIHGCVAYHSIANIFYYFGKVATPFLRDQLLVHLEVYGANSALITEALATGMKDWADALQSAAAQSASASFIISRNVKDFKYSRIPALTPKDFLRRFHPL